MLLNPSRAAEDSLLDCGCVCRYQAVLTACCLRPDLALLPSADLTEVTSLPVCG